MLAAFAFSLTRWASISTLNSTDKSVPAHDHYAIAFLLIGYTRKQDSDIFGAIQCPLFSLGVMGNVNRTLV